VDPLKTSRLGGSDVRVTQFGFGGAPLGERFRAVDNRTADAIAETAYGAGITYFDTAPQYGQGKSEARLGRVRRRSRGKAMSFQPRWAIFSVRRTTVRASRKS
jgi:D-threo-aldose 1-dehydrogenase